MFVVAIILAVLLGAVFAFANGHLKKANQEVSVFQNRSFHLTRLLMEALPGRKIVYTGQRVGNKDEMFVFTFEDSEVELFLRIYLPSDKDEEGPKENDIFSVHIESRRMVGPVTYWSLVDHSTHENMIHALVLARA